MPALTVYIDEAGDPGAKDGLRYLADRFEWLTFGALVVRTSRDSELVEWVKELRQVANARQAAALHYAAVTRERRAPMCERLASKPCRAFVLASHKSNLRQYFNPRLGTMVPAERVYNWCFRLLLERVTAWVENRQRRELGSLEPIRLILARRGHDYHHFKSYIEKLRHQREHGHLFLKGPGLAVEHLDQTHWRIEPAQTWAGLQLADVVASAFYQGANSASPAFDQDPAEKLAPIIEGGPNAAGRGLTLWPLPHQGAIPLEARPIFECYGYVF